MFNHHLIRRSLASGLVIAAAGFPVAAQARFAVDPPAGSSAPLVSAPSVPQTTSTQPGFQWGDAGIGAAGATLLLAAGALGTGMTRRRRRPVVS
jgi:hypothetical protein